MAAARAWKGPVSEGLLKAFGVAPGEAPHRFL